MVGEGVCLGPSAMGEETIRRRSRKRRSLGFLLAASRRRETSILGILREDAKFRWVFGGLLLMALALALMLPKIWITTAKGITPVAKVSGLDLLQTRSLMRSARKQQEAGNANEALQAWTSAIANNPGSIEAVRGFIQLLASQDRVERRWSTVGIGQSLWLLKLTQTNAVDLDQVAQFYRKAELHELTIQILGQTNIVGTPTTAAALALACFETARTTEFAQLWEAHASEFAQDPELRLRQAAWAAVWGPPAELGRSLQQLTEASQESAHQVLALRLLLLVQSQRLDLSGFNTTFAELAALRGDRLQDHVRHWLLLEYLGQHALAVEKARAYAIPPQTITEAEIMLAAWNRLGIRDLAVDFAQQQMPAFQGAAQLWILIGRMLASAQRWDDLRAVAVQMRNNPRVARLLGGYTFYLEGIAEHGMDHRARAEDLFRQLLADPPSETRLTYECGTSLQSLGYNEIAQALLKRLESALGGKLEFWQQMAQAAHTTRDAEQLLVACEKAYLLSSNNPVAANNYAASLLTARQKPAEAVRLTLEVVSRSPDSRIARINHALALAQNSRFTESRAALDGINPDALNAMERSYWHMGQLECAIGQSDLDRGRRHIDQIQQQFLFPSQIDWLTRQRAKLLQKPG
jgi:tetratricopeptide (TPR) repeat protein